MQQFACAIQTNLVIAYGDLPTTVNPREAAESTNAAIAIRTLKLVRGKKALFGVKAIKD